MSYAFYPYATFSLLEFIAIAKLVRTLDIEVLQTNPSGVGCRGTLPTEKARVLLPEPF
jgi:hypothetical protein